MSIRITEAQLTPQTTTAGSMVHLAVGVEWYGLLQNSAGAVLYENTGAVLHTADGLDCVLPYTGVEIDAALGGLRTWET